ncbi:30S ribosomal protein S13 [candidate division WWE3 bacterium CG08_land_8_20_14_0_20_43_13]|uniref:Small ribosomal subunit protein uS13 n=1 Tax=candidate division WWE3 bacterium CG08_land_8_20_14_0_20_43_13 TaxID=1975087 RepID=A0A2H0X7F1_UNCKA|nr:MAG: 30S ribosomal protein S13 [candidate division WWE3 bacterium CG08_land_8_20_14_0_20_43_13]
MARIADIVVPDNKQVQVSLTYIYGIGDTRAREILNKAGIPLEKRVKDLSIEEIAKIGHVVQDNYQVEGELRRVVSQNIRRLIDIRCYRGIRHQKGLPVRGQRTRSNSRTKRGSKRTVGGLKRILTKT